MANLTNLQIKEKVLGRESFWVQSENERIAASNIARILGIKYTTGRDNRGGFYICHLPTVKKSAK